MPFLAHTGPSASGKPEPLEAHLQDVGRRAAEFAGAFEAGDEAWIAGLLHDFGKYGDLFQRRLQGKEHGIDHWSAGAWVALQTYRAQGIAAALAIQGHHIGLQQASKDSLSLLNPAKLSQRHPLGLRLSSADLDPLVRRFKNSKLALPCAPAAPSVYEGLAAPPGAAMLDVRMLFSALVDADFIETEAHFRQDPEGKKRYRDPAPLLDPNWALSILARYQNELPGRSKASGCVNQLRADLLAACREAGAWPQGLFTLTAPTGAGKTLSMLAFALQHALKHTLRRVVVVMPYLTIIDQTVTEYRKVFEPGLGEDLFARYVLEHHSLAGIRARKDDRQATDPDDEEESRRRLRELAENWDAPIIVTTSVQFLESLFANRSSACRKLHRLAQSVILFDEVQTLPVSLAIPTLATLSRLAQRYQATILFATATQPAFAHLDQAVKKYCVRGWNPTEIVPRKLALFERAKRTRIEWPADPAGCTPWTELANRLTASPSHQALCVVNLKRHALLLHGELKKRGVEGLFHLSTNMCPAHRQTVLDEVRARLEVGKPCCLISTQCVEAGVDVDFPDVFRAFGPLDAIIQAAGRCNRKGRAASGTVHVFIPEEDAYPDAAYQQAAKVTGILLQRRTATQMNAEDPGLCAEYYRELYDIVRPESRKEELRQAIKGEDFVEVAKRYRLIEQDAVNLLVPYDPAVFQQLAEEVRDTGLKASWIAEARPYTISLFRPKPQAPISAFLEPIPVGRHATSEDWFIYLKQEHYDLETGLVPPVSPECLIA